MFEFEFYLYKLSIFQPNDPISDDEYCDSYRDILECNILAKLLLFLLLVFCFCSVDLLQVPAINIEDLIG